MFYRLLQLLFDCFISKLVVKNGDKIKIYCPSTFSLSQNVKDLIGVSCFCFNAVSTTLWNQSYLSFHCFVFASQQGVCELWMFLMFLLR